jgi:hypothetical protein
MLELAAYVFFTAILGGIAGWSLRAFWGYMNPHDTVWVDEDPLDINEEPF